VTYRHAQGDWPEAVCADERVRDIVGQDLILLGLHLQPLPGA
jgi:hypothetical protein